MSYYDHMLERFDTPIGVVGYDRNGRLLVDHMPDIDRGYCPVMHAIMDCQNPARIAALLEIAKTGSSSVVGEYDGANVAGIEFENGGIRAELNIGAETYEQTMTLDEFEPILAVWQRAWVAAQAHRVTLPQT